MIEWLILEAAFFIFLFIIFGLLVYRYNKNRSKLVTVRMRVFFELNRVFQKFKHLKDIIDVSLKMIVESLPLFSGGGLIIYTNDSQSVLRYYDVKNGFEEVVVSDSFRSKIKDTKYYFVISDEERKLNSYIKHTSKKDYLFVHTLKFYLDENTYGVFFFTSTVSKIKEIEYEFIKLIVDYFSFGFESRYLSNKLTQFSETIDVLENIYQRIVDNLPVGVVGIDNSEGNTIILWNDLMKQMFGKDEHEILGKPVVDIFNQELNKNKICKLIDETLFRKEIGEIPVLTHIDSSGEKKMFFVLCYLLRDVKTNFNGAVLVFKDITEKILLEKKLLQSQKIKERDLQTKIRSATKELQDANIELKKLNNLKSEFVSIVSHELRTPLTSIRGYAALLLAKKLGSLNDQQASSLGIIKEEGERLSQLIEDLLDLSKLESGKTVLNLTFFSIKKAATEVLQSLSVQYEPKNISVSVKGKASLDMYADEAKIKQVLYNLLSNAIKFTPKEGTIEVECKETKSHYFISVKDTGIGMSKKNLDKIFEPFAQVQDHLKRSVKGTGLGLTISKHIVELHHGSITVTSTLKKGSTFRVELPKKIE